MAAALPASTMEPAGPGSEGGGMGAAGAGAGVGAAAGVATAAGWAGSAGRGLAAAGAGAGLAAGPLAALAGGGAATAAATTAAAAGVAAAAAQRAGLPGWGAGACTQEDSGHGALLRGLEKAHVPLCSLSNQYHFQDWTSLDHKGERAFPSCHATPTGQRQHPRLGIQHACPPTCTGAAAGCTAAAALAGGTP
jgi:hypothetical protein